MFVRAACLTVHRGVVQDMVSRLSLLLLTVGAMFLLVESLQFTVDVHNVDEYPVPGTGTPKVDAES